MNKPWSENKTLNGKKRCNEILKSFHYLIEATWIVIKWNCEVPKMEHQMDNPQMCEMKPVLTKICSWTRSEPDLPPHSHLSMSDTQQLWCDTLWFSEIVKLNSSSSEPDLYESNTPDEVRPLHTEDDEGVKRCMLVCALRSVAQIYQPDGPDQAV